MRRLKHLLIVVAVAGGLAGCSLGQSVPVEDRPITSVALAEMTVTGMALTVTVLIDQKVLTGKNRETAVAALKAVEAAVLEWKKKPDDPNLADAANAAILAFKAQKLEGSK